MLRWPDKDPGDTLDYGLDFARALAGDTITAAAWTVPAALAIVAQGTTDSVATIWLSGGVDGTDYALTCAITTAAGRVIERDVALLVRNI